LVKHWRFPVLTANTADGVRVFNKIKVLRNLANGASAAMQQKIGLGSNVPLRIARHDTGQTLVLLCRK
jgi:hypothetical protein